MKLRSILPLAALVLFSAPADAGNDDDILLDLAHAIAAYGAGDLETALDHVEVARELLMDALGRPEVSPPPPPPARREPDRYRSNARELLDCLQYYEVYAYGKDAELDRAYDTLRGDLGSVDHFNRMDGQPSSSGGLSLDWDPFTKLIREIEDLDISYDPFTKKIREVGEYDIDYNPFTKLPTEIGGIDFDWDPFDKTKLRKVAGVDVD